MHTAHAMPCSRWMVGNTSAEYWKATGPSPIEYMMVNRYTNLQSWSVLVDQCFGTIKTYSTTGPSRAPWLAVSGTSSDRPAASRKIAMRGKVCVILVSHAVMSRMSSSIAYDQTQCTPALGVDQEQSRDGENHLDGTVAQGGVQRLVRVAQHTLEDGRTVERDDWWIC
jgi:hypothetical protein